MNKEKIKEKMNIIKKEEVIKQQYYRPPPSSKCYVYNTRRDDDGKIEYQVSVINIYKSLKEQLKEVLLEEH